MKDFLIMNLAGLLSGAAGAMGLGGGGFLMIYLTLFAHISQIDARGINLLFFLPCALVSVLQNRKNGLIKPQPVKKLLPWGALGALAGTSIAFFIKTGLLSKLFAFFLLFLGVKTVVGCLRDFLAERRRKNAGDNL